MERAVKKKVMAAIITCAVSMIAIIALFVGLNAGSGFVINIIFAGYAVSLAATGKTLLDLLRTAEDK